jgi:hypothetical protein
MKTYKDTISGEKLYVSDIGYAIVYYKDKTHRIIHRVDGPALERNDGRRRWLQNGKVHRMDGPAYIPNKCPYRKSTWYINGVNLTPGVLRVKLEDLQKL